MAFLTKGLRIIIEDLRGETPKKSEFCYEGGLISFAEYLNKNKETVWLSQNVTVKRNELQKITGYTVIARDITLVKQIESEKRRACKLFIRGRIS